MEKKCLKCEEKGPYFWKFHDTGEVHYLCFQHYEEYERRAHQSYKDELLAKMVIEFIGGKAKAYKKEVNCLNGKSCKYCKEVGLR